MWWRGAGGENAGGRWTVNTHVRDIGRRSDDRRQRYRRRLGDVRVERDDGPRGGVADGERDRMLLRITRFDMRHAFVISCHVRYGLLMFVGGEPVLMFRVGMFRIRVSVQSREMPRRAEHGDADHNREHALHEISL